MLAPFEKPTATGGTGSEVVGDPRLVDEVGELDRASAQVVEIEHALREPAEESGHAVLEHPAARAEPRGPGQEPLAEREEIILRAARAVQQQQRRQARPGSRHEPMAEPSAVGWS